MRPLASARIHSDWCPYKRKSVDKGCVYTEKGHMKTQDRHLEAKERGLEDTNPTDTLILDFKHLALRENTFLLFKELCYDSPC